MTSPRSNTSTPGARWSPSFRSGVRPAAGLVLAFTVWVTVSATTFTWLFGDEPSLLLESLWSIPSGLVQFGIVAAVYRYDGVAIGEIGLSRGLLRPAAVAVAGVVVAVNVVVAGMALLSGNEVSFGVYAIYRSGPYDLSWTTIAAGAVSSYVFVGPAEELAFRGYLQNKLASLSTFGSIRVRTATSIVVTGVIFSALHVPVEVLVEGTQVPQLAGTLVLLALSGVIFGTVYALTRNLYLVVFLHGVGDLWPLVVDPGQGIWPNYLVLLFVYLALTVVYRRVWGRTAVPDPSPATAD